MTVNYDRLESDVRHYLSSPESEGVWGKLTNSVLMNVVGILFISLDLRHAGKSNSSDLSFRHTPSVFAP